MPQKQKKRRRGVITEGDQRSRKKEKMGNTLSSTMKEGTTLLASFIDHHPYIESICYCFELLLRVLFKCLGLDWGVSSSTSEEHNIFLDDHEDEDEDDESLNKEIEKKTSEDFVVTKTRGIVMKKPPRKPPSSGGGGQINSASF